MESLLGWLSRTGLRRGLGGEGWPWLLLAASAFVLRRARRSQVETIATLKVEPGDRFEIVALDRRRRAARRRRKQRSGPVAAPEPRHQGGAALGGVTS